MAFICQYISETNGNLGSNNSERPVLLEKQKRSTALLSTVEDQIQELLSALPGYRSGRQKLSNKFLGQRTVVIIFDSRILRRSIGSICYHSTFGYNPPACFARSVLKPDKHETKKLLKAIEKKSGIRVQFQEGDPSYKNAKQRLNRKRKNELLIKLQKLATERIFLLELKAKYADGQAIAIKLPNQINKVVASMRRCLNILNEVSTEDVPFESIKDPQGEIYHPTGSAHNSSIPISVKKKVINLVFIKDRCKEELTMIEEEMTRLINFLLNEITLISNTTDTMAMAYGSVWYWIKVTHTSEGSKIQKRTVPP